MGLSSRRQRFVNAYLGEAAGNAAEAARLSGYSEKGARQVGSRLLADVDVKQAIQDASVTAKFTVEQAIEELATMAETPVPKVNSSDKLKAIELFLKVRGALRDTSSESKVVVNIGFLSPTSPSDIKCQVVGHSASVPLLLDEP